jgi:hypothetical protein
MKVKDLIKHLSRFNENLDVVFYNDRLDENHKDLIIVPTIED